MTNKKWRRNKRSLSYQKSTSCLLDLYNNNNAKEEQYYTKSQRIILTEAMT